MKTPRLRGDLYALVGTRDGRGKHRVYEIENKDDIEYLCGVRGDWMIVFEEPDNKTLKEYLAPFMMAMTTDEAIHLRNTGEAPDTSPVIYYAPPMKRLYPL